MFGTNKILKQVSGPDGSLDVHSVFYTIQGEGPFAGRAAVFIRLHGCSLACSWCDTEFEAKRLPLLPRELLRLVASTYPHDAPRPMLVITGGEPMRQELFPFLSLAVALFGYVTQIETAGIHWEPALLPLLNVYTGLSIVCSPKTPIIRPEIEKHACAFKYIISAEEQSSVDGLPSYAVSQRNAKQTGLLYRPPNVVLHPETIYVQPLDPPATSEGLIAAHERENKARRNRNRCVDLVQRHGYRMSLQQHKILGVD